MSTAKRGKKITLSDTILRLYQEADESTRLDLYMAYRDMRESFIRMEGAASDRSPETDLARCFANLA